MAATIKGTVINQRDGQPLQGASLALAGVANQTTTSGSDGTFAFNNLAAGDYDLTVSLSGFETEQYGPLVLLDGITLDLKLALGYAME